MKSDIEGMEEGGDKKVAQEAFAVPLPVGLPGSSTRGGTGYCASWFHIVLLRSL